MDPASMTLFLESLLNAWSWVMQRGRFNMYTYISKCFWRHHKTSIALLPENLYPIRSLLQQDKKGPPRSKFAHSLRRSSLSEHWWLLGWKDNSRRPKYSHCHHYGTVSQISHRLMLIVDISLWEILVLVGVDSAQSKLPERRRLWTHMSRKIRQKQLAGGV